MRHRNTMITGGRIYLRKIRVSDVNKKYLAWMKSKLITRYLQSHFQEWTLNNLRRYVRKINKDSNCLFFAIILKESGRHIGNIKVGPINRIHKHTEVGIIIGEKECWGKGFATEAIRLVVKYCFKELHLRRLFAGAYGNNIGSIKAFQNAGFAIEGVLNKHYACQGSYVDSIMLGIVKR